MHTDQITPGRMGRWVGTWMEDNLNQPTNQPTNLSRVRPLVYLAACTLMGSTSSHLVAPCSRRVHMKENDRSVGNFGAGHSSSEQRAPLVQTLLIGR